MASHIPLSEFLKKISFRCIQPHSLFRAPYSLDTPPNNPWTKTLVWVETQIEIFNTRVPEKDPKRLKALRKICRIPKMSTYAIGIIIDRIVSEMPDNEQYVNVGVWHGFTYFAGAINNPSKQCIGVDNFSQFGGPKKPFLELFQRYKSAHHYFYEKDYNDYFAHIQKKPIGFYIYDGHHSYDNQIKGLTTAEAFFSDNCIIMIDDTNREEVHRATMDFIKNSRFSYKILFDQKTRCNAHPTFWNGLIIFQRTG